MSDGRQNDFGREYEVNSHRSHISAYVLIAGLVLEIVIAFIWFHGWETVAEIVAVLLIVGGVWGEVHFAHKARLAGDDQLAQYEARTAEANQKAEEARCELFRLRTPRRQLLEGKLPLITEALKPFANTAFDVGVGPNDKDVEDFLWI